jgi:hypothetical protein
VKVRYTKHVGGTLTPATDEEAERMTRFKNGYEYEIEIKTTRNPGFHGKVFAFFEFCYAHWRGDREFMDDRAQFEVFRKNLVALAGYYDELYNIKGEVRIEAKSLAYDNMEQEEFEECYNALIRVALKNIFPGAAKDVEDRLMGFF